MPFAFQGDGLGTGYDYGSNVCCATGENEGTTQKRTSSIRGKQQNVVFKNVHCVVLLLVDEMNEM